MYLIGYCVGNIIGQLCLIIDLVGVLTVATGPQTFRPSDAPRYVPACIVIIACWGACLVDLYFIYWWCKRCNRKKAEVRAMPEYQKLENQE